MAHMASSAAVFVTLVTTGWLASVCLNYLNTTHGFPPQVYTLAGRLEIWLFYVDSVLSSILFVLSCANFVIYFLEDD